MNYLQNDYGGWIGMIKIGDVRIRVSNIKNYGIRKEEVFFEKVYGRKRKEKVVEKEKSGSLTRALGKGLTKMIVAIAESERKTVEFIEKNGHYGDYYDYDYSFFPTEESLSVSKERANYVRRDKVYSIPVRLKKGESYFHALDKGDKIVEGSRINKANEDGIYYVYADDVSKKEDITTGIEKYLYVTTFQGDNYVFGKDKIDVDEKVEELDKRFS